MIIKRLFLIIGIIGMFSLSAQEALLSTTENYYDFLALDGFTERPYLNYRTLSDSKWTIGDESGNIWAGNNLGTIRLITDKVYFRIYGPELFNSFNTAAPYGQNDGALWQGRGLNSSLTGGARLEGWGFELTVKPQIVFSQNMAFDLMPSAYDSTYGYIWGYAPNIGVDSPQRFGNAPFFDFSWGDSEIRYSWKTFTVGFGTQSPWTGPGHKNSLIHSNNASPYPKLDIGARRTPVTIMGWYAGDVEARLWAGYLSESKYFDTDKTNNHNLISGLSVAYAPGFLPGLTLGANRTFLAKWNTDNFIYIPELFLVSLSNSKQVQKQEDQRASFGFSYLLPQAGSEFYGEIGIDDYVAGKNGYIRYPFHTMVYSGGLRKSFAILGEKHIRGEMSLEWTTLELSQDFQFQWPSTFYGHHQITQGYTNEGQWLGPGIGTGGNSQYLGFKVFYPSGDTNVFLYRINPDNDFLYKNSIGTLSTATQTETSDDFYRFKAYWSMGVESLYHLNKNANLNAGFVYTLILNPEYVQWTEMKSFQFIAGAQFNF